jgi:hypothetical protein
MGEFSTVLLVELFGDNHLPLRPPQALRLRSRERQFSPESLPCAADSVLGESLGEHCNKNDIDTAECGSDRGY